MRTGEEGEKGVRFCAGRGEIDGERMLLRGVLCHGTPANNRC